MNFESIVNLYRSPWRTSLHILAQRRPSWLFSNYVRLARRQGLTQPGLILSFDCDTDLDAEIAEQVTEQLISSAVYPVFAVPGRNLERHPEIFRKILEWGCEFINHGYAEHAYWNSELDRYESCTFYNQLSPDEVAEDIRRGHETIVAVLGEAPCGFRAPHFGAYQERRQRWFLHNTLHDLGYRYSTSTVPAFGFVHGPVSRVTSNLVEIPVSGCFDSPLLILDSWGFFDARHDRHTPGDYREQFIKMIDFFATRQIPGLLNFYVDPSHIAGRNEFFDAIDHAVNRIYILRNYQEVIAVDE
ncbi:MAG: polysaccharide deacetylase family protein [bacterium]